MSQTTLMKRESLVPAARREEVRKLISVSAAARQEIMECESEDEKAFVLAAAITEIRQAITPKIIGDLRQLMNSPLGFKTDRPPGAKGKDDKPLPEYSDHVLRDVAVQAIVRNLRFTGNEINIIAGQLYATKEGVSRLVLEFPGMTDLEMQIGVPVTAGNGALVPARANWKLNGKPDSIECEAEPGKSDYRIPVRVNAAMGIDAIRGKAESKLYRMIHQRLVGKSLAVAVVNQSDWDDDTIDAEEPAKVIEDEAGESETKDSKEGKQNT